MVYRQTFITLALIPLFGTLTLACSSDDSASSPLTPFDSGSPAVPEAGPLLPGPVTVQVQGNGTVYSSDAQPTDAGLVGVVACTTGSPASMCTAPQRTTLYAVPVAGWVFSGWTTTGMANGVEFGQGSTTITVNSTTPSPLIGVFVPQASGASREAGPAPVDAGEQG